MADSGNLSATGSGGTQVTTQNPQNSTQTRSLGQSQNVQNGTSVKVLTGGGTGVPLDNTVLPSVNLTAASVSTAPPTPPASSSSSNPFLVGFSVVLFVVAIALFWTSSHSNLVKNTTKKA